MATYREIHDYVYERKGFNVANCHIAHVLADHGLTTRQAPNRKDPSKRVKPCPPERWSAIDEALMHFGMTK
jgi:hypothetical protein